MTCILLKILKNIANCKVIPRSNSTPYTLHPYTFVHLAYTFPLKSNIRQNPKVYNRKIGVGRYNILEVFLRFSLHDA